MRRLTGIYLASALAVSLLLAPVSTAVAGTGSSGSGPVSAVSLLGSQFEGDVVGDPVSHLQDVARYRLPTPEELLQAFLFFHKMQSWEQISNEYLRAELKNRTTVDAVGSIAADLVIDAMIDFMVETFKLNNWYGCTSSFCDEFAFRQLLVTTKNMAIAYINPTSAAVGFAFDTYELQAESWKATKQTLDMLPEKGTLPKEYTELIVLFDISLIDLYDLKALVDTFSRQK